jgi:ubiquinone biosynthesis protein
VHQALAHVAQPQQDSALLKSLLEEQKRTNRILGIALYFGAGLLAGFFSVQIYLRWPQLHF